LSAGAKVDHQSNTGTALHYVTMNGIAVMPARGGRVALRRI
jgi:hypothetical protein